MPQKTLYHLQSLKGTKGVLTNKYAEIVGRRYYGGCEYIDIEQIDQAKELWCC